jgi:hypothetical protein
MLICRVRRGVRGRARPGAGIERGAHVGAGDRGRARRGAGIERGAHVDADDRSAIAPLAAIHVAPSRTCARDEPPAHALARPACRRGGWHELERPGVLSRRFAGQHLFDGALLESIFAAQRFVRRQTHLPPRRRDEPEPSPMVHETGSFDFTIERAPERLVLVP